MSTFRLPVEQVGLEQSIQRAMRKFQNNPLKINVDDKSFTQPLGRITASADEFTKSIEASNARVVAFGASVAVINSIQNAFKQLVVQTVQVEKSLAEINVVLGATSANLEKFGNNLFKISKNTAQSFDQVAAAATEFARQGLSVEKTLQRTNDALVLTRLTGMKATDAVKGLTAAVNSFADAGVNTTEVMNKLAAVDMAFAVSSEDLINGLSRAAAVAQDAGMNIDQLIGSITAAQQITARGGAVIGNSFKTIFTRIQRPETLNQLEQLGIAVRNVQGEVLPAVKILENLAKTYDKLSQSQQSNTAQLVGGMFQINVLKAAMRDLGKENSITAQAIKISSQATDEASKKNEQLNKTMAALTSRTLTSLQQLAAQIGEITVGPGIEKILKAVNGLAEGITNVLDGEGIASDFANGFLKGLGNIITGPGAVLILGLVGKLFIDVGKFARTSLANFMGMTTEAQKQKQVQESILGLLRTNSEVANQLIGQGQTKTQQEQVLLDLIVKQTAAHREQLRVAQELSKVAVKAGANQELIIPRSRRRAGGHIPNFAKNERQGALEGGYAPGAIKSMNMPGEGMVIYNSAEKVKKVKGFQQPFINPPMSSNAGKEHRQRSIDMYGVDPYASKGYVPNYAAMKLSSYASKKGVGLSEIEEAVASGEVDGRGAFALDTQYPGIHKAVTRGMNARKAAASKVKADKAALIEASKIKIDAGSSFFGGPFAALIPQRNANFDEEFQRIDSVFKKGKNTYPFVMTNLAVRGPTIPVPEGQVTEPDESKIEKNISQSIFDNSAKYANTILPVGKGDVTSEDIKKKLLSAGGGKGAVAAAVGAGFESAVASAYGIDSALRTEGGDFDIKDNIDSASLKKVNQLFGLKNYSIMDFKASASPDNLKSMAKKIFNQNPSKFLDQVKENKAKAQRSAADGFIPNFAKSPLMDAIQREKDAGVPVSAIRINQSDKLISSSNPTGLAVTNTIDEPRGLRDVPNFASPAADFVPGKGTKGGADPSEWSKHSRFVSDDMKKFVRLYQRKAKEEMGVLKQTAIDRLSKKNASKHETREALKQLGFSKQETKEALKQISAARTAAGNPMMGPTNVVSAGMDSFRRRAEAPNARGFAGGVGRMGGAMNGMAFMMAAPMAGALIDSALKSDKPRTQQSEGERFSQNVGSNVLTGAATGAMMGGMIGNVVPVIGTAVGAAVGGTIGAIGGLAKSIAEMEISTAELSEATQESAAAHQSNIQVFNSIADALRTGGSQEVKDMITAQSNKVSGIKVKGQTFIEAFSAAGQDKSAQQEVMRKFTAQSKVKVDQAGLLESFSAFGEVVDDSEVGGDMRDVRRARLDKNNTDYNQQDFDNFSLSLGKSLSGEQRAAMLANFEDGTYDNMKGFFGNYDVGADMASQMGFIKGSQAHEDMADKIEDLIDDGGYEELHQAIKKSIEAEEKNIKTAEKVVEERNNFAAQQAAATMQMQKRLLKDDVSFMDVKAARSINMEATKFLAKYEILNKSIGERVEIQKAVAKKEILLNAQTAEEERIRGIRTKLLTEGLKQMESEGVTGQITLPDGTVIERIDAAREAILNASDDALVQMIEDGKILEDIVQTDKDIFREGGKVSNLLSDISLDYQKQSTLAKRKTELDLIGVNLQSELNRLQQEEKRAREHYAIQLQSASQDLAIASRQVDVALKSQLGQIDRDFKLPFEGKLRAGSSDPVALRRIQEEKELKRADAQRNAQQQKLAIELEKSFVDAFSNANNIQALDDNTEAIKDLTRQISQREAEAVAAPQFETLQRLAEQSGLGSGGPRARLLSEDIGSEIKSIDTKINEIKSQDIGGDKVDKAMEGLLELMNMDRKSKNQSPLKFQKDGGSGFRIFDSATGEQMQTITAGDFQTYLKSEDFANDKSILNKNFTNTQAQQDLFPSFNRNMNGQFFGQNLRINSRLMDAGLSNAFSNAMSAFDDITQDLKAREGTLMELSGKKATFVERQKAAASAEDIIRDQNLDPLTGKLNPDPPVPKSKKLTQSQINSFNQHTKKFLSDLSAVSGSADLGSGALNFSSSGASVTGSSDETRKLINHYNTQLKGIGINLAERPDLELRLNNVIKDSVQKYAEIEAQYSESEQNAKANTLLSEKENDLRNKLNAALFDAQQEAKLLSEQGFSGKAQQLLFDAKVDRGRADPTYAGPSNAEGFKAGFASMLDEIPTESQFFNELGRTLPRTFADNMSIALTEGLAGIKSWDDALQDVALGFLKTLQQALNQRIADQMLGFMNQGLSSLFGGFSRGGIVRRSSGGLVEGGSGTKDDVPAMLNSGEYVIRKAAVNKYGTEFLASLNQGTTQRKNEGGIIQEAMLGDAGPVDPAVYPDNQTGEGGFLMPSSGQAGTFAAGQIVGRDNLLAFARQGATAGSRDVISSAGSIDEFGQTMYQGQGLNLQLEDESMRLSGVGLRQSPVADEVLQAKQQALEAVSAYDSNVAAMEKYRKDRKKAIKNAIKGVLISAAVSFGMSQLQGAMQASAMSKSANTINVAEAGGLEAYNAANPQAPLTQSDVYMKSGNMNVGKANAKLNAYGVPQGAERSYVSQTQTGQIGQNVGQTSRGSTSVFSNFFSRGATTANAGLAPMGFQASPSGAISQRRSMFSGNVKNPITYGQVAAARSNPYQGIMKAQGTNYVASGVSWTGMSPNFGSANQTWTPDAGQSATNQSVGIRNLVQSTTTAKRAAGGRISSSKVPALLTGGEYVINKDAVRKHGLSFMNSVNSQNLNKGGKVKGTSMPSSPLEDQSVILQQILETLMEQGEQEQARAEQIQSLTEKSESTINNTTTQEIKTKGEEQVKVLTSILEAIKEQNTELPAQISNTLQNSNVVNNSTINSSANSTQSSNSSNSTINNTSNSSTSNSFVDNTTIQNNLLGEILETLRFPSSSSAPATSVGGGGGSAGSNVNITVNVDSKGNEMGGGNEMTNSSSSGVNTVTKDRAAELASQIKSAVIEIITEQQRLGGILRNKS